MLFSGASIGVTLLAIGFVGLASYVIGKWLFTKDQEIEDRRRAAAVLAGKLREMGLVQTPEFLTDYSVGDYSGMATKLKKLADLFMHGEAGVLTEFKNVAGRVIDAQLRTEEGRALLAAKLADAVKATDPSVVGSVTAKVIA
jgi:hypothetical protein